PGVRASPPAPGKTPPVGSRSVAISRRHGSAPVRIKHVEGGEILPVSGTRDHPGPLWARHGSAAGDLNARSRVGIGGSGCSNCPDSGPGRVAGSELVPNAQWLGR